MLIPFGGLVVAFGGLLLATCQFLKSEINNSETRTAGGDEGQRSQAARGNEGQ